MVFPREVQDRELQTRPSSFAPLSETGLEEDMDPETYKILNRVMSSPNLDSVELAKLVGVDPLIVQS